MLTRSDTGEIKFIPERCSQCGVCIGICPQHALSAVTLSKKQYYGIEVDKTKCTRCNLCVEVCPATHLAEYTPIPIDITHAQGVYLAFARDEQVRWMGSSGGVARTLLNFTLSSGYVDAVYSLVYPGIKSNSASANLVLPGNSFNSNSMQRDAVLLSGYARGAWLTQPVPYQAIPGSLYQPVLWGKNIACMEKAWRRVMLIGLPCQLKSAKSYLDKARRNITVITITIMCRKQKTFAFTRYLKHRAHAENALDENVFFRGEGWPGKFRVYANDGPRYSSVFFPAQCWNLPACDFCTDPLNPRFSDITLTDPWGLIQPQDGENGQNLVISWSEAGSDMLRTADPVLFKRPIATELACGSLNFPSIVRKSDEVHRAAEIPPNFLSPVSLIFERWKIKAAEWLIMHFYHDSGLFQLIQSIKTWMMQCGRVVLQKRIKDR